MTLTTTSSASGVDLTARLRGQQPVTIRGATLRDAASAMRALLARERTRRVAEIDALDAALCRMEHGPADVE